MPWSSKGKIIEDWREVTSFPIKRNADIFRCFLIVSLNDNPNHDLLSFVKYMIGDDRLCFSVGAQKNKPPAF